MRLTASNKRNSCNVFAAASLRHRSHNIKAPSLLLTGNSSSPGVKLSWQDTHTSEHARLHAASLSPIRHLPSCGLGLMEAWTSKFVYVHVLYVHVSVRLDVMESTCAHWGGEIFSVKQREDAGGWRQTWMEGVREESMSKNTFLMCSQSSFVLSYIKLDLTDGWREWWTDGGTSRTSRRGLF